MSDPKYDRVTREGLKAFGDLCKQKFAQQKQYFADTNYKLSKNKNLSISYTDIPDNTQTVKIEVLVLGESIFQKLTFSLDLISTEDKSFVFSVGNAVLDEKCMFTTGIGLNLLIPFYSNYKISEVFISTLAIMKDGTIAYLQCTNVLSQSRAVLSDSKYIQVLSSNESDCNFYLIVDDENREQYARNKEFSTIQNATQLSHNVKYIMTDDSTRIPKDGYNLSKDVVYIAKEKAGNTTLGNIKVNGTQFTGKDVPVNIDENGYAFVTLTDTLLKYKGVFNGDYTTFLESEDCKNSIVGDVWTIKPEMSESGAEYVLVEKGDTNNWEYLGEKFSQVQANWNETDSSQPSFIQNKPNFEQVQVDWNAAEGSSAILNKPSIKIGETLISTTSTEDGPYYDITEHIQKTPIVRKLSELTENTLDITGEGVIFLINDTESIDSQAITITMPEGSILLTNSITYSEENKYTFSFTGKCVKIITDVFKDGETSYYSVVTTELTKLEN